VKALPILKGAVFLDPYSPQNSNDYLLALRAGETKLAGINQAEAKRTAAKRAARAKRSTPAAPAPPASP
jgi:hypothetical protein